MLLLLLWILRLAWDASAAGPTDRLLPPVSPCCLLLFALCSLIMIFSTCLNQDWNALLSVRSVVAVAILSDPAVKSSPPLFCSWIRVYCNSFESQKMTSLMLPRTSNDSTSRNNVARIGSGGAKGPLRFLLFSSADGMKDTLGRNFVSAMTAPRREMSSLECVLKREKQRQFVQHSFYTCIHSAQTYSSDSPVESRNAVRGESHMDRVNAISHTSP